MLHESNHKPNKIWLDKQILPREIKSCLQDNDIKIYSTHNEVKSVFGDRFFRALKNNIYKDMT